MKLFELMSETSNTAVLNLIHKSTEDKFLGDIATTKNLNDLQIFYHNHQPVGFAIPRIDSAGYSRTGPIYVLPEYRRQGIAGSFIKQFFKNKKGKAFIEDSNLPSIALFTSIGFAKTGNSIEDDGVTLYEYTKND